MASSSRTGIPPALTAWLRARFPTLPIRDEWLQGCIEYLYAITPALSERALIKGVELQLLHSDLADSAAGGVLAPDTLTAHKRRIGDKRAGVLVQVVGIMDIGVSAQVQLDVLNARKEARTHPPSTSTLASSLVTTSATTATATASTSTSASRTATSRRARANSPDFEILDPPPPPAPAQRTGTNTTNGHLSDGEPDPTAEGQEDDANDDPLAAFHATEASLAASANPTVYPRSLLHLRLSDGHTITSLPALEQTTIGALSMNDEATPGLQGPGGAGAGISTPRTQLGCKLLLKGAELRRGQLLLRPADVDVLGGSIPELEARAERVLRNALLARLKKPLEAGDDDDESEAPT